MSDTQYIYAVARIRVKEKSLLSDADVRSMAAMKSVREVLAFLSDRGWGNGETDQTGDDMLADEEAKTAALMKELKVDPKIFDVLAYPQLYHNLKAAIKENVSSDTPDHLYYAVDGYGEKEMRRIVVEKDWKALPEHMQEAAARAFDVMLTNQDGQRCDVIIDRACLDASIRAGRKSGSALLREYEESTTAVTDIKIAVRAQRTGKDQSFLKEALAPCQQLNVRAMAEAAAKDEASLMEYLEGHGFAEAAEAMKDSPSAFERWCDNRVIDTIMPQKTNSVSADPVVAFYLARENEIRTVRIILTAIANGFTEDDILERVRKMYG
ncbi:MAG: V-type ATPase subunit [Lachnospiraceae bacterium]|nr:V-type ATPase subunit [Lachnospiraceae bacterium]